MLSAADPVSRRGWVRKKPSSHAKTAWRNAPIQRRYLTSSGHHVEYFKAVPTSGADAKPNGAFDLRNVTSLRGCTESDPSAPRETGQSSRTSVAPAARRSHCPNPHGCLRRVSSSSG
eukprot:772565-Prymnesium_polylepis.1